MVEKRSLYCATQIANQLKLKQNHGVPIFFNLDVWGLALHQRKSQQKYVVSFESCPEARFSKVPFLKLRPAYPVKLLFWYVVWGIKIKITAKSWASRRLGFEDTKRIMLPEMRPKSCGTFEKRAPGLSCCIRAFRRHGTSPWRLCRALRDAMNETFAGD